MDKIDVHVFGRHTVTDFWNVKYELKLNKLYYVYSGHAYYGDLKLLPNHLYIFPADAKHKWKTGNNFDHLYFDFFVTPALNFEGVIDIYTKHHPGMAAIINGAAELFQEYEHSLYKVERTTELLLESLLSLCDSIVPIRFARNREIRKILDLIHNSDQSYSLDDLATKIHLEKCYFIKLFKKETGASPYQYMRDLRLNRAIGYLKNGMPVSEVAEKSGFLSASAFSSSFQKRFGVPPSKIYLL